MHTSLLPKLQTLRWCLPAFSAVKLPFSPFPNLIFGTQTSSSAHTQDGEGSGIKLYLLEGEVSTYVIWNPSVRKICLFFQMEHLKLLCQVYIVTTGISQDCPGPPWDTAELR